MLAELSTSEPLDSSFLLFWVIILLYAVQHISSDEFFSVVIICYQQLTEASTYSTRSWYVIGYVLALVLNQ